MVFTQNNDAAVQKLIQGMGMALTPMTRDQEEGRIIETLRQGGTGQALYFRVNMKDFWSINQAFNTFFQMIPLSLTPKIALWGEQIRQRFLVRFFQGIIWQSLLPGSANL